MMTFACQCKPPSTHIYDDLLDDDDQEEDGDGDGGDQHDDDDNDDDDDDDDDLWAPMQASIQPSSISGSMSELQFFRFDQNHLDCFFKI